MFHGFYFSVFWQYFYQEPGKRWKTAEQTGTSYLFTLIWQSEISLARIGLTLRQLVKLGACDWLNVKSRIKIFKGENRNQKMNPGTRTDVSMKAERQAGLNIHTDQTHAIVIQQTGGRNWRKEQEKTGNQDQSAAGHQNKTQNHHITPGYDIITNGDLTWSCPISDDLQVRTGESVTNFITSLLQLTVQTGL